MCCLITILPLQKEAVGGKAPATGDGGDFPSARNKSPQTVQGATVKSHSSAVITATESKTMNVSFGSSEGAGASHEQQSESAGALHEAVKEKRKSLFTDEEFSEVVSNISRQPPGGQPYSDLLEQAIANKRTELGIPALIRGSARRQEYARERIRLALEQEEANPEEREISPRKVSRASILSEQEISDLHTEFLQLPP